MKKRLFSNIFSILSTQTATSLYIGHSTIDLVVLKGTLKGPKLVKFGQVNIYPDEKEKEKKEETRDEYIVNAIQRIFKEVNVKKGDVVSAISSEDTMVRYFQMPRIPQTEWRSAITFEAKRYIPFRLEEVASDYYVIEGQSTSDTMDVVFIATKKNIIERHMKLLEKAGIRPIIVEPAPFSLIRAFNAAQQINSKENTAVINIDEKTANIIILRAAVPYIIRDIPLEGTTSEDRSLQPIFEKLLAEIRLSFDFYEKQFPAEFIDRIVIYSNVILEKWDELVGKEMQTPVELGDPLRGIKINNEAVPPGMAISFGLALRDISEPFLEINLCKEKFLVYRNREVFLKVLFLEASMAVFLLIILKAIFMKGIAPLTDELKTTLSERPVLKIATQDNSIDRLEKIENDMEKEKLFLENVMSNRIYFTEKLMGIAEFIPDNIWLTEVTFEERLNMKDVTNINRKIDINGYCLLDENISGADIVNTFLIDLRDKSSINEGMSKADIVSLENTKLQDKKVSSFKILFSGP